nr:DUF1127 domain-containing protein [Rhodovulum sp. P5]
MDGHLIGARLNRLVPDVIGRIAAWNDARITRNALSKLTDRELYDIGLCRGDIDRITR